MTSWIWMKGIDVAIADPIDPVCLEDDRPSVKDLIKEHHTKIDKIRQALLDHPLYDNSKHDDLWILRFWLSHKKSKAAIDAAKYTLEFRKKHGLDEKDIRLIPPHNVKSGKIREFLDCWQDDAMVATHPHPERGVVTFLKLSSMDAHIVVEKFSEDFWLELFVYFSEWTHQWLDYVTRTTGRLTKSVRFIDLDGFKMSGFNRECMRRDGKAMGVMEDCYPQLLETIFGCNPPTFLDILWKIVRVLLPKRVVAKVDFVDPKERNHDRIKFLRYISIDDLPDFYGGKNPTPPLCWKNHIPTSLNVPELSGESEIDC